MPLFSVLCPPWLLHPLPGLVALTQAFAYPAPHVQKDQSPAQLALHPAIPCMASGSLFNDSFTENIPWLLRLSVTFIIDPPLQSYSFPSSQYASQFTTSNQSSDSWIDLSDHHCIQAPFHTAQQTEGGS